MYLYHLRPNNCNYLVTMFNEELWVWPRYLIACLLLLVLLVSCIFLFVSSTLANSNQMNLDITMLFFRILAGRTCWIMNQMIGWCIVCYCCKYGLGQHCKDAIILLSPFTHMYHPPCEERRRLELLILKWIDKEEKRKVRRQCTHSLHHFR